MAVEDESQPLIPKNEHTDAPPDVWQFVYIVFFLLGIGMLFPWNVLITADAFFTLKFTGSPFADNFLNFYSIAYNLSNITFLLIVSRYVHMMTIKLRVGFGLVICIGVFVTLTAFAMVTIDPSAFFAICMILVVISGGTTALLQNGVFALSSVFPFRYTAAVMTGQGLAGTAVALSSILTLLASDPSDGTSGDVELSAFMYFLIAVIILTLCVIGFVLLPRFATYIYYTERLQKIASEGDEARALLDEYDEEIQTPHSPSTYKSVAKKIWPQMLAVFYVFMVTLGIFPTLPAAIAPMTKSDSRLFNDLFVPFAFLIFNLFDLLGRTLAGVGRIIPPNRLLLSSLARSIFFPLFLFCNIVLYDNAGIPLELSLPVWITADWAYWLVLAVFSVSNGYIASLCMMAGPDEVSPSEKEKAGVLMINALVVGLFAGSMTSFLLRYILCSCNPFSS